MGVKDRVKEMRKIPLRKIIGLALILFGIYSIGYCFSIMAYGVSFSRFFLALGALFIVAGLVTIFIQDKYLYYKSGLVLKLIRGMFIFLMATFILIESLIVFNGTKRDTAKVDYVVVLGAGLWGDIPSLTLRQRLDQSLELLKKDPDTKIVLSGGMGPGETISEAEGMRRYLIEKGVDEKLLLMEDKSTSTKENLQFTRKLLDKVDGREDIKIKIVTSDFHMFRAKLLGKRYGFRVYGDPSPIHPLLIPAYYSREYFAVIKSLIFDLF